MSDLSDACRSQEGKITMKERIKLRQHMAYNELYKMRVINGEKTNYSTLIAKSASQLLELKSQKHDFPVILKLGTPFIFVEWVMDKIRHRFYKLPSGYHLFALTIIEHNIDGFKAVKMPDGGWLKIGLSLHWATYVEVFVNDEIVTELHKRLALIEPVD